MVRNVVRNSPPHLTSSIYRLLECAQGRKTAAKSLWWSMQESRLLTGHEVENTTGNGTNTHYLHRAALVFEYQHCGHNGQKAGPNI